MSEFFNNLLQLVKENNSISDDMFRKFNVKRGLRNDDGSGVLVGLSEISSVQGYIVDDQEVVPCPGKLYYRGIDVYEIIKGLEKDNRNGFEETSYLLLTGQLPNAKELQQYSDILAENRKIPANFIKDALAAFKSRDIMNSLARSVLSLYSLDENPDSTTVDNMLRQGISLIAKFPLITAYAYRIYLEEFYKKSLVIHESKNNYNTAENFLHLLRDDSKFSEIEAKILDLGLILHADHGGGNNSTFAIRTVASSGTDTYSAVAAALGSLKGPLHGGANLYVMKMMDDIKANVKDWKDEDEIIAYIRKLLDKQAGDKSGKIYGFGHAVYTISDPRAIILKDYAKKLADEKNKNDVFNLYCLLEKLVPAQFQQYKGSTKVIAANVDLYSGFVYESMNIPWEVYTPLFAISRISGWAAHRIEEVVVSKRIMRPAYKNVTKLRPYTPLSDR